MAKVIFESGATNHAVNDLILFTDNTRELAEMRDNRYLDWIAAGNFGTTKLYERFMPLLNEARKMYNVEFKHDPDSCQSINMMSYEEMAEYCQLYVNDFDNWKKENGYN